MKIIRKSAFLALILLGGLLGWAGSRLLDSRFTSTKSLHSLGIVPECGYLMVNEGERFALASCSENSFRQLANAPDNIVSSGISVYSKEFQGSGVVFNSRDGFEYQYHAFEPPGFESKLLSALVPAPTDVYMMTFKRPSGGTRRSYEIYFFPGTTKESWGNLIVTWSAG